MKFIFFLLALFFFNATIAQSSSEKILFGPVSVDSLQQAPFGQWYAKGYQSYTVSPSVIAQFNPSLLKGVTIEAYFGTWCGDSKREIPHFIKLLDALSFNPKQLNLIATGASDSLYKQSPGGEEHGKGIFRVPVFIVYKNGRELNRINEFAVQSLERDLLRILKNEAYEPNYKSFALVNEWLNTALLADSNISERGLAMQLKNLVAGEHELNSIGYVLLKSHRNQEALRIFRMNAQLFPQSANVLSSLAEAYLEVGNKTVAFSLLERCMNLNPTAEQQKEIIEMMLKAKLPLAVK